MGATKKKRLKFGGLPDGSPRYKEGKHPTYDEVYKRVLSKSPYLNKSVRSRSFKYSGVLANLESSIAELEGGANGFYELNGNPQQALIPSHVEKLRNIHWRFKKWGQEQVKKGLTLEPPKDWPADMLEQRLRIEAVLDVRRKELYKVKELLKEKNAAKRKKEEEKMLRHGPAGIGIRHDPRSSKPWELDGQPVRHSEDGVPYIHCEQSPYHRMTVFDYRKVADRWKSTVKELAEELKAEKKAELKAAGKSHIAVTISHSPSMFFRGSKRPDPDDFPSWPSDAEKVE